MAPWPDILAKYNNLLMQSHSLVESLSGREIPQQGARRGDKSNVWEGIVLHPLTLAQPANPPSGTSTSGATNPDDPLFTGILENLLRTEPHPDIIKTWDATVKRFVERRKGGTSVENEDIVKEMVGIREGHDARVERARKVVEELRERWDWRLRVGEDDEGADLGLIGTEGGGGEGRGGTNAQDAIVVEDDEEMATAQPSQASVAPMVGTSQNSVHEPPPTQEDALFSGSDSDDSDEFEVVMES